MNFICLICEDIVISSLTDSLFLTLVIPFYATGLFLYPLKTSKNLWLSDVFRGYRKRPVAWNGLVELGLCTLTDSINCFLKYMTCLLFFGGFYSWNQEHKAFPNKFAPICKVYMMKMFNWRLKESTVMLS